VQGLQALPQASLEAVPFAARNDARQEVGRDDLLGRVLVAIDGEGDALVQEGLLAGLLAAHKFLRWQAGERLEQGGGFGTRQAIARKHLVIGTAERVVEERTVVARA
ncbi:MAG: hypothetical protein ACK59B_16055, partial [Alphaproteobacteria bacterium]